MLDRPVLKELVFLSVRISLPKFNHFSSNDRIMSALTGSLCKKCKTTFKILAFINVVRKVISLRHFSFDITTASIQELKI